MTQQTLGTTGGGKVRCAKCGGWKTPRTSTRPRRKVPYTATERPDPPPSLAAAIIESRRSKGESNRDRRQRLATILRANLSEPRPATIRAARDSPVEFAPPPPSLRERIVEMRAKQRAAEGGRR